MSSTATATATPRKPRAAKPKTKAITAPAIAQATTYTAPFVLWGDGYQAASASPNRGYLMWPTTDTRRQMTPLSRSEILRRVQWLYAHFGFCRRLVNGMARLLGYVVPQPNTSDDKWNDLAYDTIVGTLGNALVWDIQGKFDGLIGQVQDNISIFRDGFTLAVMTETQSGRPRLAYYEAHQVRNGPQSSGTGWTDGVLLSRSGAHLAYSLRDGEDPTKFSIVDARDCSYFGNFENRGQVHAISILVPAVLNMIDIVETRGAVKTSIKNHARLGTVIEQDMPSGHNPAGGFGGPGYTATQVMPDGTEQTVNFEIASNNVSSLPLKPGQRLKVIADDRPSQNFMDFERVVLTDCCHAADLDYQTLCDLSKITGPSVRYLNSALKRWTLLRRYAQVKRVHRMTVWALAKEIKSGRLRMPMMKPGEQWWARLEYIGLADMDIDGGRTAQATLTDLRSGQTTWLTEAGTKGNFWKRQIKQAVNEVVFAELECLKQGQEAGIPEGRITPERVFPDRFTSTLALPPADEQAANYKHDTSDPADTPESPD